MFFKNGRTIVMMLNVILIKPHLVGFYRGVSVDKRSVVVYY
jgi:hypothetical protein